jgi:hypothetical protein
MAIEKVTVINELTGKPITFAFETDPAKIATFRPEYQDEDGNWYFEEDEEEEE